MQATNFDLARYLQRIGFTEQPRADVATLQQLMRHQLFQVPFENLDVQAGKIVSLVPEEIVEKIIDQQRGGYCYEVNGLFAMALQALGIAYQFVAARPMFYPVRRPKTHMAMVVQLGDEQWLCDLGFGSYGIRAPMALSQLAQPIQQDHDTFRLLQDDGRHYVLQALVDGEWVSQYGFDLSPQEWIDFMPANYLNSTHPDAIFVQKLLVIKHHEQGRHILLGDQLKTVHAGQTTKQTLRVEDIPTVLRELFGLSHT